MPLYYSMRLYYIITCTVLRTLTHSKFRPSIHWPISLIVSSGRQHAKKTLNVSYINSLTVRLQLLL